MSETQPIPCPHCGAEARFFPSKGLHPGFWICQKATRLGGTCSNNVSYSTREAWQNQPTPPRVAELEKVLEQCWLELMYLVEQRRCRKNSSVSLAYLAAHKALGKDMPTAERYVNKIHDTWHDKEASEDKEGGDV